MNQIGSKFAPPRRRLGKLANMSMRSRIREVRKAKGLTLAEVAARVRPRPTTAQTIGRLETGRRHLSLAWLHKLAAALEVGPDQLLSLPNQPDCPLVGLLGGAGVTPPPFAEMIDLRLAASDPVAVRVVDAIGPYRAGDVLIIERVAGDALAGLVGEDVFVEARSGGLYFGRLLKVGTDVDAGLMLAASTGDKTLHKPLLPAWGGRPVMLLRRL